MPRINVLDKGFVELIEVTGSEEAILEALNRTLNRVDNELTPKNYRRIEKYTKAGHNILRHCGVKFFVKAPLEVRNQIFRHIVGIEYLTDGDPPANKHNTNYGWNERSFRYTKDNIEFYWPEHDDMDDVLKSAYSAVFKFTRTHYEALVEMGYKPEDARKVLPAYVLYTSWDMTCSLEAIINLIAKRRAKAAQYETRLYANAMYDLVKPCFPNVLDWRLEVLEKVKE